jgi:hypothetical protein
VSTHLRSLEIFSEVLKLIVNDFRKFPVASKGDFFSEDLLSFLGLFKRLYDALF